MTSKILRADSTEITGIKSVTFTEKVNSDIDLRPGCVSSACIVVEVFGSQSAAPAANEALTYYQVDDEGNETLIGVFYAEPSIPSKMTYAFTAYDSAYKLETDFSVRLNEIQDSFPMTLASLVGEALDVAGLTLSGTFPMSTLNVEAFYASNITCRQIVSWAAEIACRFVRCDTSGNLVFDWYSASSDRIGPGEPDVYYKQNGLTYANYDTEYLDNVAIRPSNTEGAAYIYPTVTPDDVYAVDPEEDGNVEIYNVTVTDDGNGNITFVSNIDAFDDGQGHITIRSASEVQNVFTVSNNVLLNNADASTILSVAQNIYDTLRATGIYRPATIDLFTFKNPFRAGDIVNVTDIQGVSFKTLVMSMTVTASGARLESTGNETYSSDSSTLQDTLANLSDNIVKINKLKVDYAEIDELIANWIRTGKITVEDENGNIIFNADAGENEVEIGQFEVTDEGFISANASSGWTIPYNVIITKAGNAAFRSRMVGQEFVAMNGTSTPYYARITNGGIRYYSGGSVNYNPATGLIAIIGGTQERSISDSNVYIPDETSTLGGKDVGGTEIWKNLVVGDGEFGDRDDPGNMGHLVFTGRLYQMQSRQTVYSPFVFRDVLADIDSCVKKSGDTMTGNLIINGSTDVGAALADSGWQNVTYETGFQDFAATNLLRYRKVGKVVQITGAATPTAEIAAGASAQAIFQLPTGYRPVQYVYTRCQGSDLNTWLCSIGPDGYVSISRYGTTSSIAIPSGAWLPMSVTFLV